MSKDFDTWNNLKKNLQKLVDIPYFHDREVWWCSVGSNLGSEVDGKNSNFERPVVIIKKFNKRMFWGVPLTSKEHQSAYHEKISFGIHASSAILSQLTALSSKRLIRKIGRISRKQHRNIVEKIISLL